MAGDLTAHFSRREFACPCCGRALIHARLVERLEVARQLSAHVFKITSGFRCPAHNASPAVEGAVHSPHLDGLAVDIATPTSSMRYQILRSLILAGVQRIEIGAVHVHADVATGRGYPQGIVWLAGQRSGA